MIRIGVVWPSISTLSPSITSTTVEVNANGA
jgi:hypothetical protein